MAEKKRLIFSITLMFLVGGGLLYGIDFFQAGQTVELPFTLFRLFVIAFLLVGVLAILFNECHKITEKVDSCEQKVRDSKEELMEAQAEFNETVERRTFEISVINASLNREIAERMQAESEGKILHRRIELILDSTREGIFGLDSEGNVTFTNKAASKMLGWEAEEFIGRSHHDLVHHTHSDGSTYLVEDCPIHKAYKDGKVHYMEDDVFWTRNGSSFHVAYSSTPIRDKEQIVGAVIVFSDISGRLQLDKERINLQRRMELILDSAGEGIFGLDTRGNVTFTNKAASKMLGWDPEELVGKSHHDLVHHSHSDGTTYRVEDCPIHKAYKDGKVHYMEDDVFWSKDGGSFHVAYSSTPIRDRNRIAGAVIVFSDISDRLQRDKEQRNLQRRMELILDSTGEGIFGLDTQGNVTFTNKSASLMLGWEPEELVGKSHHELVHHSHGDGTPHPAQDCPIHMSYRDGKVHFDTEDVFWRKDGTCFSIEYISTPIRDDGVLAGAVVAFRDPALFNCIEE